MHPQLLVFFCVSVNKCFIRIVKLCASDSFMFRLPLFLGRNRVFLAIDSGVLFWHKYWNMFVSIFCIIFSGMGNALVRKVVLTKINVFIRMDFPYNHICLIDIFCIWYSIFITVFCQLRRIVSFKSSEKSIPKISMCWCCSNILILISCFRK